MEVKRGVEFRYLIYNIAKIGRKMGNDLNISFYLPTLLFGKKLNLKIFFVYSDIILKGVFFN